MTSRRKFLGGALALAAAGTAALARRSRPGGSPPAMADFYPAGAGSKAPDAAGRLLAGLPRGIGGPVKVELRSLEVGHFHDLMHGGDGRVAYLYEATLPGPILRRGFVALDGRGLPVTA